MATELKFEIKKEEPTDIVLGMRVRKSEKERIERIAMEKQVTISDLLRSALQFAGLLPTQKGEVA